MAEWHRLNTERGGEARRGMEEGLMGVPLLNAFRRDCNGDMTA
jgi:hypothetical protein